ncbi:hypothetical protein GOP47_0005292 [Adiantum capillus-veneris]|uniref:Uncharacterized protein n=1 Tax=Adiantum capillus-veneris TaxID=13818 RepID=A0A9D4V524_ADICA|nr:hypothetical protein GOP47_0005292 [Adiantum capillus-veneris]
MRKLALAKHAWRKFSDYMRYDFKEIVFPSAMPDPPGTVQETPKLPWRDYLLILRVGTRVYIKSFKNPDFDIDEEFDLVLNSGKARPKKEKKAGPVQPSTIEDLAVAARAGSEHIRPALHRVYMTKVSAYKDALKNFVEGYQEGLTEVLNPKSMSELRTSDSTSDAKSDSPGIKTTEMKAEAKETEVSLDIRTQRSHIDGSETKTEINTSNGKKDTGMQEGKPGAKLQ